MLKKFSAICDLQGLQDSLEPISSKGILFGSRATGNYRSGSDYDLFVVSDQAAEVQRICGQHPLGKKIEVVVMTEDEHLNLDRRDAELAQKLEEGIVMWGLAW